MIRRQLNMQPEPGKAVRPWPADLMAIYVDMRTLVLRIRPLILLFGSVLIRFRLFLRFRPLIFVANVID